MQRMGAGNICGARLVLYRACRMDRPQHFDLAAAAQAALAGRQPPSTWDSRLRSAVEQELGDAHHREARFLIGFALTIAVLSLSVDLVVAPQHIGEVAAFRLGIVVPLGIAALLLPRHMLGLQKVLMALLLTGFAVSLAYASLFVPPPSDALLALGVVSLLGFALPVLPFRGWEVPAFVLLYFGAVSGFVIVFQSVIATSDAYLPIMVLTAGAATVLTRRVHWLERRTLLATLEAGSRAASLQESNTELTEMSMEDPLTGLANRRRAEENFAAHFAMPVASGHPKTALLILDIDHFKEFNDRWGHQAGDDCLRAVAEVMRHTSVRYGGLAARFGGEEFVMLLRADDAPQALAVAEDLRVSIERIEIVQDGGRATASCTASIGIALHQGPDAPILAEMISAADEALYRAKAEGRNRSVVAAQHA